MEKVKKRNKKGLMIMRSNTIFGRADCSLAGISRATKRKQATMIVAIPDDLAEKIMQDQFGGFGKDWNVVGLRLEWEE
jgi:hypothetical protein